VQCAAKVAAGGEWFERRSVGRASVLDLVQTAQARLMLVGHHPYMEDDVGDDGDVAG
jgi:phosphohistidine phosphatase SixA